MPVSPFWVDETMPKGRFEEIDDPDPKAILVLVENVGATIPELRLPNGALVLRIARGRKSRKVRAYLMRTPPTSRGTVSR